MRIEMEIPEFINILDFEEMQGVLVLDDKQLPEFKFKKDKVEYTISDLRLIDRQAKWYLLKTIFDRFRLKSRSKRQGTG